MEGGERWRMLRCAGGKQDKLGIMNRTMLRFRPIAPKPIDNGSTLSGGSAVANKNSVLTSARTKRKYVRVQKNSGYTRKNKEKIIKDGEDPKRVTRTTLQLLPEKLYRTVSNDSDNFGAAEKDEGRGQGLPVWLANYIGGGVDGEKLKNTTVAVSQDNHPLSDSMTWLGNKIGGVVDREKFTFKKDVTVTVSHMHAPAPALSDLSMEMHEMMGRWRVESWVTVECVTGTCYCMNTEQLGTVTRDAERMRSDLEVDTCPGFISDRENMVEWLNGAFKSMASQQRYVSEIAVWLVIKDKLPYTYAAMTCQVKLQYLVGKEKYCRIVPCDLWRMEGGGFAWRLDVKAALTLGR